MKFETGKTYGTPSICNSDCIFSFTVMERTAKMLTIVDSIYGEKRVRITLRDGVETCRPHGNYSMAPTVAASEEIN